MLYRDYVWLQCLNGALSGCRIGTWDPYEGKTGSERCFAECLVMADRGLAAYEARFQTGDRPEPKEKEPEKPARPRTRGRQSATKLRGVRSLVDFGDNPKLRCPGDPQGRF